MGTRGGRAEETPRSHGDRAEELERANANLTNAAKATAGLKPSDVLEKAAAIEAMVTEAGERLRARWQLEQATRERETRQREREAAERARGTR